MVSWISGSLAARARHADSSSGMQVTVVAEAGGSAVGESESPVTARRAGDDFDVDIHLGELAEAFEKAVEIPADVF